MNKVNLDKMLQGMFSGVLSEAEIKAIVKSRGLPKAATESRELLRQAFLSDAGMERAIAGLSQDELLLLNVILSQGDVDSHIPALLYDPGARFRHGTFSQIFTNSAKETRSRLVQKGVLGVTVLREGSVKKSACERTRFFVPEQVAAYLPTGLATTVWNDAQAEHDDCKFRQMLEELVSGADGSLSLKDGVLMFRSAEFSVRAMQAAMTEACQRGLTSGRKNSSSGFAVDLPIIATMMTILGRLAPTEGVAASALEPLRAFLFCGHPDLKMPDLCEAMFAYGLLSRQKKKSVYRPRTPMAAEPEFRRFIQSMDDKQIAINRRTIGAGELADLAKVAKLSIDRADLVAKPDLVRLSHHRQLMDASPFLRWLCEQHEPWRQTAAVVDERLGRTFVHDNLLLAHITDLTLRMAVQKGLQAGLDYVQLEDEWFAFAPRLRGHIHAVAQKLGHAAREEMR